ncbi:MAG: ATP-binding protein [Desulfobulbaceae bacterium]|nr:ATP-binding protein [Desulfobulbaceae bacterium]HIJ78675.1 GAF domain-containing protein [Deltaproteobacteria bacterium]
MLAATISTFITSVFLLTVLIILYRQDQNKFTSLWLAGATLLSLHYLSNILASWLGPAPFTAIAAQETAMLSSLFFLLAALSTISRHDYYRYAAGAAAFFTLLIVIAHLIVDNFQTFLLPTYFFFALIQAMTAVCLYHYNRNHKFLGGKIATIAMALWALNKLYIPFIRSMTWIAPWDYTLESLLGLLVCLGGLILFFERWQQNDIYAKNQFQLLFDNNKDGVFIFKLNATGKPESLYAMNKTAADQFEADRSQPTALPLSQLTEKLFGPHETTIARELLDTKSMVFNREINQKSGEILPVEITAHLVKIDGDDAIMASARDLRASRKLEESILQLIKALSNLDTMVYVADLETHQILYANETVKKEIGDLTDKPCWGILQDKQEGPCKLCKTAPSGAIANGMGIPYTREVRNQHNNKWYRIASTIIGWHDGRMVSLEVATDISNHKQAENMLQRERDIRAALTMISEKLLDTTPSLTDIAETILDQAKKITNCEHGFVCYLDQINRNLVPITFTNMLDPADRKNSEEQIIFPANPDGSYSGLWGHALNTQQPFFTNSPAKHYASEGTPAGHIELVNFLSVPVHFGSEVIGQIALANSKTEFAEWDLQAIERLADLYALALQQQQSRQEKNLIVAKLRQSQKMEAIGTLAGGIAHDFNNILHAILGYAQLTVAELPKDSFEAENLRAVISESRRATELVQQILTFSRKSGEEKRPVAMQYILKESLKLLRGSIPTTIEIRETINTECGPIMADITQLHQVIVNLCTNAYHAMQEKGGLLSVSLTPTIIGINNAADYPGLATGDYVKLIVQDNGCGMDEETMEQIFTPYFTTKDKTGGTGLGLATVQGIVTDHHGTITVQSDPEFGSTFEVLFPVTKEAPLPKALVKAAQHSDELSNLNVRVLLVDDELPLANMEKKILEKMGCTVKAYTSSVALLETFTAAPDDWDLVITDQNMPEINGFNLAKNLLQIRPDLPIILTTGYSETVSEKEAKKAGISEFILKPLSNETLSRTIYNLIKAKSRRD